MFSKHPISQQEFFEQLGVEPLLKSNRLAFIRETTAGKKRARFTNPKSLTEGIPFLKSVTARDQWFKPILVQDREYESYQTGFAGDATVMPGFHADIDFVKDGSNKAYPPNEETVLRILEELPIAPTIVVRTGGGLHVYWLFDQPYIFEPGEPDAAQTRKAFGLYLAAQFAERGYEIDRNFSLSSVMRTPGVVSKKHDIEVQAFLIDEGARASIGEWRDIIVPYWEEAGIMVTPADGVPSEWLDKTFPLETRVARAAAWLKQRDPAIQGQGGDNHTTSTIWILLAGFALPPAEAMPLLLEWNETCQPPWKPADLQAKVNHTASKVNGDSGFMFFDEWAYQLQAEVETEAEQVKATAPTKKKDSSGGNKKTTTAQVLARAFVKRNPNLIYLRGRYYDYDFDENKYAEVRPGETRPLDTDITRFLAGFQDSATNKAVKDVELNVRALVEVMAPPTDYEFWLDGRVDDDRYLPMRNGLFNVSAYLRGERGAGLIEPHTPAYFHTANLTFDYDPEAEAPNWEAFIEEAMRGDANLAALVQEAFGYTFVYDSNHERFFVFYGPGGTGKSVTLRTLERLVGRDNVSHLKLDQLKDPFLVNLYGMRVNIATETKKNAEIDDSSLKTAVSHEHIMANQKYRPAITFVPLAVFFYATNFKTRFQDTTTGMARRLRAIPFLNVVASPDPEFFEKRLLPEMPGIFNWALRGLERVDANEWTESIAELVLRNEFLVASSSARLFMNEHVVSAPASAVLSGQLYKAYADWAKSNGYNALSSGNFKDELLQQFPGAKHERITGGPLRNSRVFVGLGLVDSEAEWGSPAAEVNVTGDALIDVLERTKEALH